MADHRIIHVIGRKGFPSIGNILKQLPAFFLLCQVAQASNIQFSAQVDSSVVGLEDSVVLKLIIRSDGASQVGDPQFSAPDFEVVGQSSSLSISSQYDASSGGLSTMKVQELTRILRPTKQGSLRISQIQLPAEGKTYSAPDITVEVSGHGSRAGGGGGGIPSQPQGALGGPGLGRGLPRQKLKVSDGRAMIRVETDKSAYYKGEQVVVSYYLYHQMRIFNIQVDKFPVLNGFLREDLDVPVMGQRLDSELAVINGVSYERSLLARYAAYPLHDGKMDLDSMSMKFNYYTNANSAVDEDDPFFGFFQQMVPKAWSGKSDPVSIQVLPLPEEGRPKNFTGAVGDFNVSSAVDKYEVHANEALSFTLKVEGRGNTATLQAPKGDWPSSVEFFDSKGKVQPGKQGVSSKVFEYVLIPRVPGRLTLPSLELSFFDPMKKAYYTKSTEPVNIQVSDPLPGSSGGQGAQGQGQIQQSNPQASAPLGPFNSLAGPLGAGNGSSGAYLNGLKPFVGPGGGEQGSGSFFGMVSRAFLFGIFLIAGSLSGLVIFDSLRKRRRKSGRAQAVSSRMAERWNQWKNRACNGAQGTPWKEVVQVYEGLADAVVNALENKYSIVAKSMSRSQLEELLVREKQLAEPLWQRIVHLLEYSDQVRFASSAGGASDLAARIDLAKWVDEAESLVHLLGVS